METIWKLGKEGNKTTRHGRDNWNKKKLNKYELINRDSEAN